MPRTHSADCGWPPSRSVVSRGRSTGWGKVAWPARAWSSCASTGVMPRCLSSTRAWVHDISSDPRVRGGAAMLVEQLTDLVAAAGRRGPPGQDVPHRPEATVTRTTSADDRVERPARCRPTPESSPLERRRARQVATAAQEGAPVGLDESGPSEVGQPRVAGRRGGLDHQHLAEPHLLLGLRSARSGGDDGAELVVVLGVDEHLGERRVRRVIAGVPEDELGVGRAVHGPFDPGGVAQPEQLDGDGGLGAQGPGQVAREATVVPGTGGRPTR